MLIKEKKNRGFTLVEVIVSMLVLSITIVSVLSAFSLSAKANAKTKKIQLAESLLEDLVEYTGAYSKEFDPEKGMDELGRYVDLFGGSCTVTTAFSVTNDVEVSEFEGITEGAYGFKVKVTRDRNPAEYSGTVNTSGTITFGESGSKTVLVDADVSSYDTTYFDMFRSQHVTAVVNHNLEEDALYAADPSYTKDLETELTESQLMTKMKRELRFELTHPSGNTEKVQMTGYVVYTVADDVYLEDGASRTRTELFFKSEEYDSLTSTVATPQRLKQMYVLYKASEKMTEVPVADIRILDKTNVVNGLGGSLDANIFLVYQKDTLTAVNEAINKTLAEYYTASEKINVSFVEPTTAIVYKPTRVHLYCSADINVVETRPATVEDYAKDLVASNDNLRVVTVNIEVLDPETNQVLAQTKEAIACLQ